MLGCIGSYWDGRSSSYSNAVLFELGHPGIVEAWETLLRSTIPGWGTQALRVLDCGCGPGFFSILAARAGCAVAALDYSAQMLAQAQRNVTAQGLGKHVSFHQGDAQSLPFTPDSFDVLLSRNLSWTLAEPGRAYASWLQVLRPGGILLNFDANWYRYLDDHRARPAWEEPASASSAFEMDESCRATEEQSRCCERIAAQMPLTRQDRPGWDLETLGSLGAVQLSADTGVWRQVWTPGQQACYRATPLFMVRAQRA